MNTMTKSIAAIVVSCATLSFANASTQVVAADTQISSKLCVIATSGNTNKLARAIKETRLSKHYVANEVTCNQQSIVSFVEQYGENVEKMNKFITNGNYNKDLLVSSVRNI